MKDHLLFLLSQHFCRLYIYIYISLHCHYQNNFRIHIFIKVGSNVSHINVPLIVRDKVTRQCPEMTSSWREGGAKVELSRVPSAYQPSALLPDQTFSLHMRTKAVHPEALPQLFPPAPRDREGDGNGAAAACGLHPQQRPFPPAAGTRQGPEPGWHAAGAAWIQEQTRSLAVVGGGCLWHSSCTVIHLMT